MVINESKLSMLGEKLVSCDLRCEGINNSPAQGIIPRCLILEKKGAGKASVVVGLNPGKCNQLEKDYYLSHGIKYSSVDEFFEKIKNYRYFKLTRDLLDILGFDGNILWTDLAKCESLEGIKSPPIQTLRVCIGRFLREEINMFQDSTIFALGNVAFNFCALSFPHQFVIGVPHPTGSHGDFSLLMKTIEKDPSHFINKISDVKDLSGNYKAIRLTEFH